MGDLEQPTTDTQDVYTVDSSLISVFMTGLSYLLCCNSDEENRMNRLRYREKRAGERCELYMREVSPLLLVPLAVSPIYTCNILSV
jgi:hypothetical protein